LPVISEKILLHGDNLSDLAKPVIGSKAEKISSQQGGPASESFFPLNQKLKEPLAKFT
jgi:hypothetical protein